MWWNGNNGLQPTFPLCNNTSICMMQYVKATYPQHFYMKFCTSIIMMWSDRICTNGRLSDRSRQSGGMSRTLNMIYCNITLTSQYHSHESISLSRVNLSGRPSQQDHESGQYQSSYTTLRTWEQTDGSHLATNISTKYKIHKEFDS